MNTALFLALFLGSGLVYLVIGIIAGRHVSSTEEYFLAGRNLSFPILTFTLVGTQLGGGAILGTAQEAYSVGLYGLSYSLGMALGFILLSLGFASKLRSFNIATIAELFTQRYQSTALRTFASLLSAVCLTGILTGLVIGARGCLLGLGITSEWVFLLFWLFIVIYTMLGGLAAVAFTDSFQVLVILVVFVTLFAYTLITHPGSLSSVVAFTTQSKGLAGWNNGRIVSFFLMPALLSLIEQDLAQRFFAARTKAIATMSAIGAGIILTLFAVIPVYFGTLAHLSHIPLSAGANPLVALLEKTMPDVVVALVVCAIFAAITSTADSLLCAISSNLSQDFEVARLGFFSTLAWSKIITVVTGIAALILAYFFDNILEIMTQSYELMISCLFVPLIFCFFTRNTPARSAWFAVITGLTCFIFFRWFEPPFCPRELATLICTLIAYAAGYIQQKPLVKFASHTGRLDH